MSTIGILLPCDGGEPEPVSVGDYTHIQALIGGCFDVVSFNASPEMIGASGDEFTMVGYVHDEGMLIGLPVNAHASLLFGRELVGPVVVVSGTSPKGKYDGENHDLPEWFNEFVFSGEVHEVATQMTTVAKIASKAIMLAVKEGLFSRQELDQLLVMMQSDDEQDQDRVAKACAIAIAYAEMRADGMPPMNSDDKPVTKVTDEMIAEFFNNYNEEGK
jgi:hypothetical protein